MLVFAFQLVEDNLFLGNNEQFYLLLRWSGVGTAVVGGILAWKRQSRSQLLGALLLLDLGSVVTAVSLGSEGVGPALLMVHGRFIGLILALAGLSLLSRQVGEKSGWLAASFSQSPRATIFFAYGMLSLVGLPLTPGFSGRWALLSLLAARSLWPAVVLLAALAAGVAALVVRAGILSPATATASRSVSSPLSTLELISLLLLAGAGAIALFPYPLLSFADRLARLLT